MALFARVTTRREATGLITANVDWVHDSRMILGSFSHGEARARARNHALGIGRVPLFMDGGAS